jgi:outer membrane protein assembly factor BamA
MKKIFIIISLSLILFASHGYSQSKNIFFLFPFYTPETSLGLVFTDILHFKKDEQKHFSTLNLFALYTLKNQCSIGAVPSIYFDNQNYLLEGKLIYTNFLRKFYGVGRNTIKDDEEEFINRAHGFGVSFSRKIIENFMFGLQYDLSDMTMQDTDDDGQLQYCKTNGVISGFGFKAKFDTRDNNIYPTKGVLIRADYILYNNRFGSKYNYSKTKFDFRNYFYIYEKKLLFSYQLYSEFTNGISPIQTLPAIGGSNLLRGFYANRFIDNILLTLQPELKIKITNSIWLALFTGVGNVYENLEDIDLKEIKTASGLGVRMKIKDNPRMNFRIDFACSNESHGTYFTLMEAF